MMASIVCGIDEAGRGPVIGPMVLACVVLDDESRNILSDLKIRDSKKMSPKRRTQLEPLIKDTCLEWSSIHVSPAEIDRLRKKMSLNLIEADKTAKLVAALSCKPSKLIVDAADSVEESYREKITLCLKNLDPGYVVPDMVCEHRADDRYLEVSCASVVAKVERDRCIEELKSVYGDFGSGYPSDEHTQAFVKELVRGGQLPDYVRKSWGTLDKSRQACLFDY